MLTVKKVFIFINLDALAKSGNVKSSTFVTDFDYRLYDKVSKEFAFLAEQEISYQLPDNINEIAAESMESALVAMRAKHHAEQQAMIDRIAGLRQLAAPKEGELVDDRDLREGQRIHRNLFDKHGPDDEADDATFDDFPF
ncbi:hypothetical protein DIBBI_gp67 [Xanthomonas phage vB_XveM_DIBBI]|uniref:Uncharacterized protein n=1 Tax=Xanthomonas phage vB_XveM_DIBBI TaxID=1129194 RepID=I3PH00_9CAUD|nr:hypothetical protein DIBBI_gp67 [Xanthomonas phage vB_XveM_DIBBI]AEX65735.1 hypothetical protein DIBBI_067 [Xanthomonas phage vB_XveM_DIBBI]